MIKVMNQIPNPDQFTERTQVNWLQRLKRSPKIMAMGIILFIASFFGIYLNEDRVNIAEYLEQAIEVSAKNGISADLDQELVYANGALRSMSILKDQYHPGINAIRLVRKIEIYSWKEVIGEKVEVNKVGGGETQTKEYSYTKDWDARPSDSANFRIPEGHQNPEHQRETYDKTSSRLKLENINLDSSLIGFSNSLQAVDLSSVENPPNGYSKNNQYFFTGDINKPQIGDKRISYKMIASPLEKVFVLGQYNHADNRINPYLTDKEKSVYKLYTHDKTTILQTAQSNFEGLGKLFLWISFAVMWVGLIMMLNPLSVVFDVIPFLGTIGNLALLLISLLLAISFTIITVIIAKIALSPWAIPVAVLLILGIGALIITAITKK